MKKLLFTAFLLSSFVSAFSQQTIHGTVMDYQNLALPGVSIHVKNTNNGTISDVDGNFYIAANPEDSLVFTMIGMQTLTLPVKGTSFDLVVLQPQIKQLENVVVIGYGTSKSKDLTSSIQTISGDEISSQVTSNPAQALQGKVAGLMVTNSGDPGSDPLIRIRGLGTILSSGNGVPLFVVDGIIVNSINFLNNDDIENITILKDASSGAIYGIQAANGVVLITTKTGKKGPPQFSLSTYSGIQHATNGLKMANTSQYLELLNQRIGLTGAGNPFDPSKYPVSTQWYKELVRNSLIMNHDFSVTGGTDKSSYQYSIGYFYQDGILKTTSSNNNNFQRLNFRAKSDYYYNKNLTAGYNLILSKYNITRAYDYAFYQAYLSPPAFAPKTPDGNWTDPTGLGFSGSFANPVAAAYYYNEKGEYYELLPSAYLEVKLWNKLRLRSAFNSDLAFSPHRVYSPVYYVSGIQNNTTSSLSRTTDFKRNYMWDNTVEYSSTKNKQEFKWMIGNSIQGFYGSSLTGQSYNVPDLSEGTLYLSLGNTDSRYSDDSGNRTNVLSWFSRLNYTYDSKYLLIATIRADGSSNYNQKWGYFPSLGLGWIVSEEHFMKSQHTINYLKLRGSWGRLGNNNVPANSEVIVGAPGPDATGIFGGNNPVPGLTFQTVYRDTLRWETVEEYDGGFDMYSLQNKLNVSFDYYTRVTHNAVFPVNISTISGSADILSNNGEIRNRGIEAVISWSDKSASKKFMYTVSANFSTVANKVLKIFNGAQAIYGFPFNGSFVTRTMPGQPIGSFYGYKVAGVFQSNADVNNYKSKNGVVLQPDAIPGDLKFENINGDDIIDANDRTSLGSPIPKVGFGLSTNLYYLNWDISFVIQGVAGNKIFNLKRADRNTFPDANFDYDFYQHHWNGSGSSNTYPSAALNRRNIEPNSFFVESGSYVRLRNVQLGYTLPKNVLPGLNLQRFRVYIAAQNPLTVFGYHGYTPEIGGGTPVSTGIDQQTYPLYAIYTVGLNLTF